MNETRKYDFQNVGGANPHDYLGRKTVGDPLIAADLLRNYADPIVAKYVDLDHLQSEPTHFFGPSHPSTGPKEVILDVPYIAHLHDPDWRSEVLIIIEHKSAMNLFVPLQVSVQANLSLYKRWTDAGRPVSNRKFKLPIALMVMLYCGAEDLDDDTIFFQGMYDYIPEELESYVHQFKMLVVNLRRHLRRFGYHHLPGNPDTQVVVETMLRAFDGTLAEHLPELLARLGSISIDDRILELIGSIAWYTGRVTNITPEQISQAITNTIKGKGGIEMAEVIQKGIYQQGFEDGEARGEARGETRGKRGAIFEVLQARFNQISPDTIETVNKITDLTALASHLSFAVTCSSIEEFAESLK